jgi:hypothetical protein
MKMNQRVRRMCLIRIRMQSRCPITRRAGIRWIQNLRRKYMGNWPQKSDCYPDPAV